MKLNHFSLPTRDAKKEAQFFVEHFGARIEFTAPDGSVLLKHGEIDIVIESFDELPTWHKDFHFGFELETKEEVEKIHQRFKSAGVSVETDVYNRAGRGSRFFARTPGGVQFEVLTREDIEKKWKAVQISEYGTNDVVEMIDTEVPKPNAGEVLVKVHAAGVNPIDWKIRAGAGARLGLTLPIMLGGEIVGRVEKVGPDVSTFRIGDVIYGMVKTGAFAEYVIAKETDIVLKPKNLDDIHAAGLPLAGLTAWQGLFDLAKLGEGQRILITGASGAVGSLAVQFAKSKGAYVIGTASLKNEDFVKNLGVDEFINYETQKFEDIVKGMDVIFDTVGGETFEKSFDTVKKGGVVVSTVAFPSDELSKKFGVEIKRVFCKPDSAQLSQISRMFENRKLQVRISQVFPLAKVKDALVLSESGRANGKVVLQVGA